MAVCVRVCVLEIITYPLCYTSGHTTTRNITHHDDNVCCWSYHDDRALGSSKSQFRKSACLTHGGNIKQWSPANKLQAFNIAHQTARDSSTTQPDLPPIRRRERVFASNTFCFFSLRNVWVSLDVCWLVCMRTFVSLSVPVYVSLSVCVCVCACMTVFILKLKW